jgi:hypothetical protein
LEVLGSGFNQVSGSGIRNRIKEGKNDPQKKFDATSCYEVLDVLFLGLKASPVAWTSFMEA